MSVRVPTPSPAAEGSLLRMDILPRVERGERLHSLLWRAGPGWRVVSSAVLGGGLAERLWVLNAQVSHGYRGTDPAGHLASLARAAGVDGAGVGMMTAAQVRDAVHRRDEGAEAVVTAGLGVTEWAASPAPGGLGEPAPGTVNIIAALPVPLTDAALVNAVVTATEAKTQALLAAGYDCSGTPTDAVCVAVPVAGATARAEAFAGPRSLWGARLARAVHHAVRTAAGRCASVAR